MSNALFPTLPGLEWSLDWAPEFKTKIQVATSGKEYRTSMMSSPKYALKMSYEFLRAGAQAELQTLLGFFLARRGSFDSFLFVHPDDNAVTDQLIGVAHGSTTMFQLLRGLTLESAEPVQNINQVQNVKVNGVTKAPGADYTISASGLVMFSAAPLAGNITWSGSYYYRARFADDAASVKAFMQRLYSAKKIDLIACLGQKI